jgi:site-specific DNA-methyltransferase (adenine-specific)
MKPYYESGGITIYNGDCLDILPTLPKADLILTDPPYESEAHTQQRVKRRGLVVDVEALEFPPMTEEGRRTAATLISKLARRWVLTFCQIEAVPLWRAVYEEQGLVYKRTCIWVKPDGMPQYSGDRPGMGYETILAMHTNERSQWNGGGRNGVFTVNKNEGKGAALHPTQKPIRLINELINLFSNPGETVLDPFMGSGTTLRSAKDTGRNAVGIEMEEKFCEIAVRRLAQECLFGNGGTSTAPPRSMNLQGM